MALTKNQKIESEVKAQFAEILFEKVKENEMEIHQTDSSAFAVEVEVEGKKRFIKVSLVLAKADYDVDDAVAEYVEKISEREAKEKEADAKKAKKIADAEKKKAEKEAEKSAK